MFVRCSHPNVSTFSDIVSTTGAIFSPNVSRVRTMFVRRRRDVCESLQLLMMARPALIHAHGHRRHVHAAIPPPRREDGMLMVTQKLLDDGNIHHRSPSLELCVYWDGGRLNRPPSGVECSSENGSCPSRGTSDAQCGADCLCCTHQGLYVVCRRATITPAQRSSLRLAG